MARMTPPEANAVNVVATYLAGQPRIPREVARALEVLASRAHNRIQTGWDEHAIRRQWPEAFDDNGTAPPPEAPPGPKVVVNVL